MKSATAAIAKNWWRMSARDTSHVGTCGLASSSDPVTAKPTPMAATTTEFAF